MVAHAQGAGFVSHERRSCAATGARAPPAPPSCTRQAPATATALMGGVGDAVLAAMPSEAWWRAEAARLGLRVLRAPGDDPDALYLAELAPVT